MPTDPYVPIETLPQAEEIRLYFDRMDRVDQLRCAFVALLVGWEHISIPMPHPTFGVLNVLYRATSNFHPDDKTRRRGVVMEGLQMAERHYDPASALLRAAARLSDAIDNEAVSAAQVVIDAIFATAPVLHPDDFLTEWGRICGR